jgi:hypothetical protein
MKRWWKINAHELICLRQGPNDLAIVGLPNEGRRIMPSIEARHFLNQRSRLLPGAFSICEFCGQQPESIAFDPDECRDRCPIKRDVPVVNCFR